MNPQTLLLFLTLLTQTLSNYCQAEYQTLPHPPEPLQYVQLFTRHGDRAPMNSYPHWPFYCYPTDVISDTDTSHTAIKSCSNSELTIRGQRQLSGLGNFLRHYFHNINFDYKTPQNVYVRSTNIQRTISSALNLLKGLYGIDLPKLDQFAEFEIRKENENFAWNFYNCKKNTDLFLTYNREKRKEKNAIMKMMRVFEVNETDPTKYKLNNGNDYLNALRCHGEDLPCKNGECLNESDYQEIWKHNLMEHNDIYGNINNTNTLIGYFVKDVIEKTYQHIKERMENRNDIRIAYFSGHDTTLYPLLPIFGFSTEDWPPYASMIMIEFVGDSLDQLKVRVSYNGSVARLPFCENKEFCELDTYLNHMKSFIPSASMC